MNIHIERIERLNSETAYGDVFITRLYSGIKVESIIYFESGNSMEATFNFPKHSEMSFEEAERLIRRELGAE
ncbi:hypothetical protein [Bacillus mojavensis]|uniref:hypothetical protein n=1 Tax=Bacillus mojavensis TaxID=72360 RepID=UPI002280763F|nr:hypothetical protein [Bacillus mojavensis]MCY9090937.1 hypothetical protein [Bacillus mojavensis]